MIGGTMIGEMRIDEMIVGVIWFWSGGGAVRVTVC